MKKIFASLVLMLLTVGFFSLSAQTAEAIVTSENLVEVISDDGTFYSNEDNRVVYVDFENINFNLNDVVVKSEDGSIVLRDEVLDMPVDAIYEIDLSQCAAGKYLIELRSFTGFIKKEVDLR